MSTIRPCQLWQEDLDRYTDELEYLKAKARSGALTQEEQTRLKALPWKIESMIQRQKIEYRRAYQPDVKIFK
nr:MAG TPA: hypothetical protein [Caudoviricetes sp.]